MAASRPSYRTTLLLSGFVVLGWIWDLALGGGLGHSLAWLAALLLVGGINALAVRGGRLAAEDAAGDVARNRAGDADKADTTAADSRAGAAAAAGAHQELDRVRLAAPAEFGQLIEVEQAADTLFKVAGYGQLPPPATVDELAGAALLLVVGAPPIGYLRVEIVDGRAHIEGLSVRPKFMRRGIGSRLVEAACEWAAEQGYREVSLCTFAEVAWNGPFYQGLGFVELAQLSPGVAERRATEQRLGLDAMGRRIAMVRRLDGPG